MSLPLGQVIQWHPPGFATAAARTRRLVTELDAVRTELLRGVAAALFTMHAWTGAAARRAQLAVDERVGVLGLSGSGLSELVGVLDQADQELAEQVGRVEAAAAEVDATTHDVLPIMGAAAAPLGWLWWRQQRLDALDGRIHELVILDRRLGGSLTASAGLARALRREHDVAGLRADLVSADGSDRGTRAGLPPAGTAPPGVADWWTVLPASARLCVAGGGSAARVGQLDGLPAAVRDQANRIALARRLAAFNPRTASTSARAAHDLDLLVAAELDRLARTLGGLPVLLLLDDPAAWGIGRAAIALGDPDVAGQIAYVVPGLGTTVRSSLRADDDRATRLLQAASPAAGGISVINWIGYRAPTPQSVALPGPANDGAALLARDVSGLITARGSRDPHLTVIGHSYGSTTAALATAQAPEVIDDLVLVGSPGAGAERAADLAVRGSHVWVGASDDDPVTWLGWFGPDPASAQFGAERFPAEVTDPGPGWFDAHGHYFDGAGESLASVGAIIAGNAGQVPRTPRR